ncbi:MAG: M23 family metallopeptidase [Oscillospiraceae bacterium]
MKKLLLKLVASKKSRRGVGKALGGILIIIIILAGLVFSMMSIGNENNRQIVYASFSLQDIPADMDVDSTLSVVNMKASFETIDAVIKDNELACDALWLKSVFFARYIGQPRPSHTEVESFTVTFANGAFPSGITEDMKNVAGEALALVNEALYGAQSYSTHADIWALIKDDTSPFKGVDFASPIQVGGYDWRYYVTSEYGNRRNPTSSDPNEIKFHGGMDIAPALGTEIRAAQSGTVLCVIYSNTGYGNHVVLYHGGHISTLYGHCQALLVSEGQTVAKGQVIATVGSTGNSTGPHVHFEVIEGEKRINPRLYLL